MNLFKSFLRKFYNIIFKNKIELKRLSSENETLKYQMEYMKRHFDITQMKPATGWLRDFQLREIEFAKEIISLFEKEGITLFLESGSLIGAIRHKGFIPFDDDIDLDVVRDGFNKIVEYSKNNFVWIDTSRVSDNFLKFEDDEIKKHPNEVVVIMTPFSLHFYKGKSLGNCVNVEIFPYDYVRENISKEEFGKYVNQTIHKVEKMNLWKDIFDFYESELNSGKIFSKEKTSKIVPGLGHGTFFHQRFLDFQLADDIFPIKYVKFDNSELPVPFAPENVISKIYPNWRTFPSDVGISKDLKTLNDYLITIGETIPWQGC